MPSILPDVEALLVRHLRGHQLLAGVTVVTSRPAGLSARLPLVQLARIGGLPDGLWRTGPRLDRAAVGVQCWDRSQHAACDLARRALAACFDARGHHATGPTAATVAKVAALAGLSHALDSSAPEGVHRYTFAVTLTVHP